MYTDERCFQIRIPEQFISWVETMDAMLPGVALRLIRGPMWSGVPKEQIGNTMDAKVNFACISRRGLSKRKTKECDFSPRAVVQVNKLTLVLT